MAVQIRLAPQRQATSRFREAGPMPPASAEVLPGGLCVLQLQLRTISSITNVDEVFGSFPNNAFHKGLAAEWSRPVQSNADPRVPCPHCRQWSESQTQIFTRNRQDRPHCQRWSGSLAGHHSRGDGMRFHPMPLSKPNIWSR